VLKTTILLFSMLLIFGQVTQGKTPKRMIKKTRKVSAQKAYDKISRKSHISIIVTIPLKMSDNIVVEIYNNTKYSLGNVDFNLFLKNNSYTDFNSHITVDNEIMKGRSAIHKIGTGAKGNGRFPPTENIWIENLQVFTSQAAEVKETTYVTCLNCVWPKKRKKTKKY